mmetsp:Transcript_52672/g.85390  ORF Transcript_52672/g.85390 Transcript_52672/m.85390 type:complete len:270 (+) Transcript_52672:126-935(+)|eukprot:CAMPEP_0115087926 /NCGR_PEP_ID=MMETSP0227-20121206/23653_1 /TAXON_ID=89957 /ORGANISM="Polarella glacialis, Strain CCMP 1383" /LENGTH=269 /DNA_ID=CAMNT_0002478031 /DNA_START=128 /DNA_END=937 /DNA_ORIENTATION=+
MADDLNDSLDMPAEGHTIEELLAALEKHRHECELSGRYEEAELARMRLDQLRQHEERSRREALLEQQLAERMGVEEAHMLGLQEFNSIWDKKQQDFDGHASNLQTTLATRHKQEHIVQLDKLRREVEPRTPRWSRDLLNLRKIQETLAKMKKYAEAEKTKVQGDKLEATEHSQWKEKREARIAACEEQFLHKQQMEMGGLMKRLRSSRDQLKQARHSEMERVMQRYQNLKSQMENQQRIIQQRVERYPMTAPVATSPNRPNTGSVGMKF